MLETPTPLSELIKLKNAKLMQLENEKSLMRIKAMEIAELERQIADEFISRNEPEKAIVNMISQASCLVIAEQFKEAVAVFYKCHELSKNTKLNEWILNEIAKLGAK